MRFATSRMALLLSVLVLAVVVAVGAGCGKKPPAAAAAPATPSAASVPATTPAATEPAAATAPATTKVAESGMATCPVTGETLKKADMIPYNYKGKTIYFCCADCKPKFEADPEKYLNKQPKPPTAAPEHH